MPRRRDRLNYRKNLERYKVQDDRSGFTIWSNKATIDKYHRVVTKENNDPLHPTEMIITIAHETQIPFARPEGPNTYVSKPTTATSTTVWNLDAIAWDSDSINWEDE